MFVFGKKRREELDALRSEVAELRNMASLKITDIEGMSELFGVGATNYTGVSVSADTAMRCSAVFACVRLIASCVSSSPLITYRRSSATAVRPTVEAVPSHPISNVLLRRPAPSVSASTFWKTIMQHKLVSGNAYAYIVWKGNGRVDRLVILRPSRVTPYQAWQLGLTEKFGVEPERLFYYVTMDDGTFQVVEQEDMLHFPNIGWNGTRGLSTISAAAQSVGLGLAQEEHGARFFGQGAAYNIGIEYPKKMNDDDRKAIIGHFERRQAGLINSWKPLIVTDGGQLKPTSMSAQDAQLIQSREFSVIDICRFFGVPPVMIGESTKTTSWGSGVEQMAKWFVTFTLNDHFTDIEQELEFKLFGDGVHFAEFDEEELTRGDTKTLFDAMKIARGSLQEDALASVNEIRTKYLRLPPDANPESDQLRRAAEAQKEPLNSKVTKNEAMWALGAITNYIARGEFAEEQKEGTTGEKPTSETV